MNNKILDILKNTEGYISGEEIGEKLGVSRTAVWKAISKLKKEGYNIEAVNNRGYHIIDDVDIINEKEIQDAIHTEILGKKIIFKDTVTSTNDVIKYIAEKGEKEGTVAVSEIQTAGRGRMGRKWESERGDGLWFSILLRPDIDPRKAPMLTLLAGLCVCRAARRVTGLDVSIKWPNDVIINDKKICGILTEMSTEIQKINYIVVGIGINVNTENFPEELSDVATSLKKEAGKDFSRKELLNEVLKDFEMYYNKYVKYGDFSIFTEEYEKMCNTIGRDINVIGRETYPAKAVGINESGELIVEKENGTREIVFSGEVSVRRR